MTIRSQTNAFISQLLALAGSLPDAAANIYMSQEIIIARVSIVHINMVAARIISWTKSHTDVGSHSDLTDFLIHNVSYTLNLHWPFNRHLEFIVIPAGESVCACVVAKKGIIHKININISQIFFISKIFDKFIWHIYTFFVVLQNKMNNLMMRIKG